MPAKDEKIALFYMGGTFGCIGEPLAPMPYDQFLPQLEKVIPTLNSSLLCCAQYCR